MPFLFCMSVLEYVYKEVERMEKHIYQTYVQVLKEKSRLFLYIILITHHFNNFFICFFHSISR